MPQRSGESRSQPQDPPAPNQHTGQGPQGRLPGHALTPADISIDSGGVTLQGEDGVDGLQFPLQVEDPDGHAETCGAGTVDGEAGLGGLGDGDAFGKAKGADGAPRVPEWHDRPDAHGGCYE